jgi:predicted RNA-binding protein with RPS1 domain
VKGGRCFPARAAATCSLLVVREKQEGERSGKKKRKEMKRKKGKFRKIKDNLRSWSKIIFVKKVICLIINK